MRLDSYLFEHGYTKSRNSAKELIKNGKVEVEKKIVNKPSFCVEDGSTIRVLDTIYVSRAGLKLESLLSSTQIDISKKIVLDIGSSSGGFAQVLLSFDAKSIVCVDVGKNQLDSSLRSEERITLYEEQDIRDFDSDFLFDIVTCDVSFISLSKIIGSIDRLTKKDSDIILLFKPQFEVGKDAKRDKKGVVKDFDKIEKRVEEFKKECGELRWKFEYEDFSKIRGKEGNREIFLCFKK